MRRLIIIFFALAATAALTYEAHGQTRRQRTPSRRAQRARNERQSSLANAAAATKTASGLTYLITRRGTGRLPKIGETVVVHYTGMLTNGVKFDSSLDRGEPFSFKLGAGRVIKGWDEGIARLHVGDQAILVIPPQLGYGTKGVGDGLIPPDATLIFVVELVDVKATPMDARSQMLKTLTVE